MTLLSAFQKFCCKRNQDLYEFIVNERKKHESAWNSPISVDSHKPHGSEAERHLAKEKAYQRYCRDSWGPLRVGKRLLWKEKKCKENETSARWNEGIF